MTTGTTAAAADAAGDWPGRWVCDRLEVALCTTRAPLGVGLGDLLGLAVRHNPRRAHLLVSTVLGKHLPTDPRLVLGAGLLLGELVRRRLVGEPRVPEGPAATLRAALRPAAAEPAPAARLPAAVLAAQPAPGTPGAYPDAVVVGYAETATGLGHGVADSLRTATCLHSTRRAVPGTAPYGGFTEEHSHASAHLLFPARDSLLGNDLPLVLVDDELSTGTTAHNTITALHRIRPRARYVIAALADTRTDADRARMDRLAAHLGTRIDVVALTTGQVYLPDDVLGRAGRLLAATAPTDARPGARTHAPVTARRIDLGWPATVPETGRRGFGPAHRRELEANLGAMAERIAAALEGARRVLVLGVEELMYAPLRLAAALADTLQARGEPATVRFSTTTRSPVLAVDEPGYAVRTALRFPAHDDPADGPGDRWAYNIAPGAASGRRFDVVILVIDAAADTPALSAPGGLLAALRQVGDRVLLAVVGPAAPTAGSPAWRMPPACARPLTGPSFGSYAAAEVRWLLTDLSSAALEAPTEQREHAIQSGAAHYAESLPVEYRPSPEYRALFDAALARSAQRVAAAVGVVTEAVLARRGTGAVLVSLARAGTPIGILMRRWAAYRHGIDLAHYAISIVRGRGIDTVALEYLAAHHDPGRVMFVDGWTGKGAIARELATACAAHRQTSGQDFAADLAVLADPGHCVGIYGTRDDFLVPSACLNSTVSGLVSRTVLNAAHLGPGDFHGAKFYRDLAGEDVSHRFLDAVTARFDAVRAQVDDRVDARTHLAAADGPVTWAGWTAVTRIADAHGITDLNLVKPGVGETTRVLLRRVPWLVLERAGAGEELAHVRRLASDRGVPVRTVTDLPYSCVGLIHPRGVPGGARATRPAERR